jgi:nucleotidyltransferase/DNA polymerase involved in DNA repair
MQKYGEVSERIMEIVREHVPPDPAGVVLVEQASVDEAYLDLSFSGSYEKAERIAREIKDEIKMKEHLTASVGIGPNKLIAKIASDRQKPDGLTVVHEKDAEAFLEPLNIRVIPGVGPKSEAQFLKLGIRTVRDAKRLSGAELTEMMGKWGTELYEKFRGRDDSEIALDSVPKSIGEQTTFGEDIPVNGKLKDRKRLEAALAELAADVHRRLRREIADGAPFKSFRSVGITVRFSDFTTKTRGVTLKEPIAASDAEAQKTIQFQALRLFMPFLDRREDPLRKPIRLLGVKVERFT